MTENYDHRWEALAEIHFSEDFDHFDENYIYCLCSRVYLREGVKYYTGYLEGGNSGGEEDAEMCDDEGSCEYQDELPHMQMHFPSHTSFMEKRENEGASCYYSASHTDNGCSIDEQVLQSSDSGADLTYPQTANFEVDVNQSKLTYSGTNEVIKTFEEDYSTESSFDHFWTIHGERLIWASWIEKYSEYINPEYLDKNNQLDFDDHRIPTKHSVDQINSLLECELSPLDENVRERKYSFDSKVNPYHGKNNIRNKNDSVMDNSWNSTQRVRSTSEHERLLSPRTVTTDSMTNVTKMTLSNYDMASSQVISDSSRSDDISHSSSLTTDLTNDHTRVNCMEDLSETFDKIQVEEIDHDEYWQFLWKQHFGEQYALHYANFLQNQENMDRVKNIQCQTSGVEVSNTEDQVNVNKIDSEIKCQVSDSPLVELSISNINNTEPNDTERKANKKRKSNNYLSSVGVLLQNLRQEEQIKSEKSEVNDQASDTKQFASQVKDDETHIEQENIKEVHQLTMPEAKKDNIQSLVLAKNSFSNKNSESSTVLEDYENSEKSLKFKKENSNTSKNEQITHSKETGVSVSIDIIMNEEAKEGNENTSQTKTGDNVTNTDGDKADLQNREIAGNFAAVSSALINSKGDDFDPPDDKPVTLKRSHEADEEDPQLDKIKSTLRIMGLKYETEGLIRGEIVYRKRNARLRVPRYKEFKPNKIYFDDDGNPMPAKKPCDESEAVQTDEDCPEIQTDKDAEQMPPPSLESGRGDVNLPPIDLESESGEVNLPSTALESNTSTVNLLPAAMNETVTSSAGESDLTMTDTDPGASDDLEGGWRRQRRRRSKHAAAAVGAGAGEGALSLPPEIRDNPHLRKYWLRRHQLFHRFDEGVRLDAESWWSVTPELVARHVAERARCDLAVDAFCGAGGNAIQLAHVAHHVIAIDIDPGKIALARHNARVYGVEERIQWLVGDFLQLAPALRADAVFLSPPWGGPQYLKEERYDVEAALQPVGASRLLAAARAVSHNLALYLPKNARADQLVALARESGAVEIEQNFLGRRLVAITAYFGDLVK